MDYKTLARKTDNESYKEIFEIIGESQPRMAKGVLDAAPVQMSHSTVQIEKIKGVLYNEVLANYARDGSSFITLKDAEKNVRQKFTKSPTGIIGVKDDFYNLFNGIGTSNDSSTYNMASVPMMMGPWDSTALYSAGGIQKIIVDKKVNGVYSAPTCFEQEDWKPDSLKKLAHYADGLGFRDQGRVALQDSLIYGGDVLVPAFDFDNALTYEMPWEQLEPRIKKDSLQYFWTVDRWNTVVIPTWNVSVADYLTPQKFYVPIAGVGVHTSRAAVIKTQQLPYWAAIRQLGWNTSDFVGYSVSALAYDMAIQAINMMCQQSSLMYTHVPLDGMLLQNGPDDVQSFIDANNNSMRNWSTAQPKTFNNFGEIKLLERNYAGFDQMVMMLRQDIAARCDLPESDIFSTQAKGFSDNTSEVTTKKAEVFRTMGERIAPRYKNVIKALVLSCFGPGSPESKLGTPRLVFDSPIVQSNDEKMKAGAVFFGMLEAGKNVGMELKTSLELAKQFAPDLVISSALQKELDAVVAPEPAGEKSDMEANKKSVARKKKGGGEDT